MTRLEPIVLQGAFLLQPSPIHGEPHARAQIGQQGAGGGGVKADAPGPLHGSILHPCAFFLVFHFSRCWESSVGWTLFSGGRGGSVGESDHSTRCLCFLLRTRVFPRFSSQIYNESAPIAWQLVDVWGLAMGVLRPLNRSPEHLLRLAECQMW